MSQSGVSYEAEPLLEDGLLKDVLLRVGGKTWRIGGKAAVEREAASARELAGKGGHLPVFLGSGLGAGLEEFLRLRGGPVAVVDKEQPILAVTGCRERFGDHPGVRWIDAPTPEAAVADLTRWQTDQGGLPLAAAAQPVWTRLDPAYYGAVRDAAAASAAVDFWSRARAPRFTTWPPRVLLLTSKYFLIGEAQAALNRLGFPNRLLEIGGEQTGRVEFVEQLLRAVVEFRPDFVLTINHLGVDREGVLTDLLEKLNLPLASWFVDNPHLILYVYERLVSPSVAIFTWDADNVPSLKDMGFSHVEWLPLGVDAERFRPRPDLPDVHPWRSDVSFVGNSMFTKVAGRLKEARPPRELLLAYRETALAFGQSDERSVRAFLERERPRLVPAFRRLGTTERQLAFEALLTWESTRAYRLECVRQTLPFTPLIVGDKAWRIALRGETGWRWNPELGYYADLPLFYPMSKINFNCTSKQMKGAVNQRVFDAPACGAFVLTDHREQMDLLFEPGREAVSYAEPAEAGDLIRFYLKNDAARLAVARAARRRVLAEHVYERRMEHLCRRMRAFHG